MSSRAVKMIRDEVDAKVASLYQDPFTMNSPARINKAHLSRKIRLLRREGYPQKQAVAVAFSIARRKRRG